MSVLPVLVILLRAFRHGAISLIPVVTSMAQQVFHYQPTLAATNLPPLHQHQVYRKTLPLRKTATVLWCFERLHSTSVYVHADHNHICV